MMAGCEIPLRQPSVRWGAAYAGMTTTACRDDRVTDATTLRLNKLGRIPGEDLLDVACEGKQFEFTVRLAY